MKLVRTFHPVGHGAFYTERFYDEHDQNIANIVFDCGRYEAAKEGWCYQSYKTWIEDYVKITQDLLKTVLLIFSLYLIFIHPSDCDRTDYDKAGFYN